MFTKCYFHNTSSLTSPPPKGKAALCLCCRVKAGEGGKSLWMHDRIYIKLFDFLAKEEMARYKQTFKGSLELLISNLFPLPLALLKITVLCSEWKVINISWKVYHGIRHFLGESSASFRCDLSVPLPSCFPCVQHSLCFVFIRSPGEARKSRWSLLFSTSSRWHCCPMARNSHFVSSGWKTNLCVSLPRLIRVLERPDLPCPLLPPAALNAC